MSPLVENLKARLLLGLLLPALCSPISLAKTVVPELTVYAYDSFASKRSLGPFVAETFEKAKGVKTNLVSFPSAGEALNQIAIEGKQTRADILVGVDISLLSRAKSLGVFLSQPPESVAKISPDLLMDAERQFIPFDYGFLAIVYDEKRNPGATLPKSLKEIASHPALRKKLAIQDPRASSIGLSFLLWTHALFKAGELESFWKGLASQVLTVSPGWSGAYALFVKKQADFVVSYSTSPAYHLENDHASSVRALIFPEGHFRQVEGVGIVKSSPRVELARRWVSHLLSPEVQAKVPSFQWMYPAVEGTKLPDSFSKLPKPKAVDLDHKSVERSKKEWIRQWAMLMSQGS